VVKDCFDLKDIVEKGKGKVYLIGAGPGDPGLFTLKGKSILERADVVVYDHLANDDLLKYCQEGAECIYVGKQGDRHTLSQGEINALLIQKAREGYLVARLKGGDPCIFGRGGEEAEHLEDAGIAFEIVPGVSSAVAAPAYAGIPLTHRDYASSVAIVTGHEDPRRKRSKIKWGHLAHGVDTLVFLMGVKNLEKIASHLLSQGRDANTPAAIIRWGTTAEQRTITAPLERIAIEARKSGLEPPAVLVVGDVVSLRSSLSWFERAPLFGRRILVTRSREQASQLSDRLRALGADPIEVPTIKIMEPDDWAEVDRAIEHLKDYEWILFTSPNGVKFFLQRLKQQGGDVRDLKGIRIGAIGPGTAQTLESLGVRVDVVPREYRAESLAAAFSEDQVAGKKFLLPRAEVARQVLPEILRNRGASVDVVSVYRTEIAEQEQTRVKALLEEKQIDVITFTSSSTVSNFADLFRNKDLSRLLEGITVACIGPITGQTAEKRGIRPHILPQEYTIPGLVDALVEYFGKAPLSVGGEGVHRRGKARQ
jgi:uroporphyrinogen III methyltransferase/synthase